MLTCVQRSANVGEQIYADTNGKITEILDNVAIESSASICAKVFSSDGGIYCNLLGIDCPRKDVKSVFFLGYGMFGEKYIFEGDVYPAVPEDFNFAVKWTTTAEKLWAMGRWKNHPEKVREEGLLGAVKGMQEMREDRGPSGEKWVYRVDDTMWP